MLKGIIPLFFCLLFVTYSEAQSEDLFLVHTIPSELMVKANAVVRYDYRSLDISGLRNLNEKYTRIITVFNKQGERNIDAQISYDQSRTVKKLSAIIYNKYGKEIEKFRKSDFEDVSSVSDNSLYDDDRIKYLDYTATEYPFTVKFTYEINSINTAYLPSWNPLEGYYISTQLSKFEIAYNDEVGIKKKEYHLDGYEITNNSIEGLLSYEAKNVIAIKPEAYSPMFKDFAPHLKVTPKKFYYEGYVGYSDEWGNLGKWMYDQLLKDRTQLSQSTKIEIKAMVEGVDDPIEKAKIVYKYVQDRTRYISVQEGIGGIQPIAASRVDEVKYGDCKGLTNYTKALMDVVGVESNYSRVYASSSNTVDIDKEFVTFLGMTNHVILNIPNGEEDIWLECTSQTNPFGYIANFTDDRDVLIITPEGGKIVHTKIYKTEENLQVVKAAIDLDVEGTIQAKVNIKSEGYQYALREGYQNSPLKDQELHYKNEWDYVNNLKVDDISYDNNKDQIIFTESINLSAKNYASKSGTRLLFQPNVLNRVTYIPTRYKKRALDFEIERGFTDTDEFTINIDPSLEIEAMPKSVSISNMFGSYSMHIEKVDEHTLKYYRTRILNKGYYSNEDYNSYRAFVAEIVKHDKSKIVLISKP
ncbi:hypothetical protein A9Q87_06275 [Flavobacteriales bacterium 34_180_T64]|nr:hypothetical protein A9Q87_06275 [Flavobacteriales bacterium 34_180_T64]